ncbi:MAG: hypothetical protein LUQ25_06270 [Methanoregulaceae archaeon]|nr:hypothetical protein [Methanoregulaceae archaeon]
MRVITIILLCIAALIAVGLIWGHPYEAGQGRARGLVPGTIAYATHAVVADGRIFAYPPGPVVCGVPVTSWSPGVPREEGPVLLLITGVRLIVGDIGGLDMSGFGVAITNSSREEALSYTRRPPLGPGGWIIARKSGTTPFHDADSDAVLEPGEQFDLLLFPKLPVYSGREVTIRLAPPGSVQYSFSTLVPVATGRMS